MYPTYYNCLIHLSQPVHIPYESPTHNFLWPLKFAWNFDIQGTELPPYADAIRDETGLPVFDAITNADFFISARKVPLKQRDVAGHRAWLIDIDFDCFSFNGPQGLRPICFISHFDHHEIWSKDKDLAFFAILHSQVVDSMRLLWCLDNQGNCPNAESCLVAFCLKVWGIWGCCFGGGWFLELRTSKKAVVFHEWSFLVACLNQFRQKMACVGMCPVVAAISIWPCHIADTKDNPRFGFNQWQLGWDGLQDSMELKSVNLVDSSSSGRYFSMSKVFGRVTRAGILNTPWFKDVWS